HCLEHGWNDTLFHGFLNNKVDFKRNGWSRASSPWLLDEPANWHDYWALKWYGEQFHEGVRQAHAARSGSASDATRSSAAAHLLYRCDISRPEWQRDSLDHLLDYNVVQGGAYHRYRGLVSRRQADFNQVVVVYGSSNPPQASNIQPAAWCWDTWLSGADGVVPWQTVGTDQSWRQGEDTCLFYPGKAVNSREPIPSWRLKSYLRGQQDVEYFTWLATVRKLPRWQVAQQLLATLKSADVAWQKQQVGTGVTNAEDAGRLDFGQLQPGQLERVRRAVAKQLDAAAPAPQRRLRDWPGSTPRPPLNAGPATGGYVSTGDFPPRAARPPEPKSSPIAKKTKTIEIQGKASTSDVVIDPAAPQRNVGAESRDNRLYRNDSTNAMLVRFDVRGALRGEMRTVADALRLRRATLTFYVWDPSSQGRTKIEARPVRTEWDEASATWEQPVAGKKWRDGKGFSIEQDCGPAVSTVVVASDPVNDIADPPVAYSLDITNIARNWIGMSTSNHGVALCPVIDRSIDEGQFTRFQVTSS
ncbi:MAG TPA: DNRLRE domain-containing protein, partial [Pirellulaceae bacterium]|nr:DNRLRE domain-containing protein [Pirellulaceae bacterium]